MEQPFQTTNKKLAFALLCAGCKFARTEQDGPAHNTYTPAFLRQDKKGKPGKRRFVFPPGTTVEQAAQSLIADRIPGIVTYFFQRDETLNEALAAWNGLIEEFQSAKATGREPMIPTVSTADTMRVLFVAQSPDTEKYFERIPFINTGRQLINTIASSSDVTDEKECRTVTASGKVWTVGASREVKDHLHL